MQHVYTFDYLEHGLIGLQFRNSAEGETMQLKIKELAPKMDALYQLTDIKNRKEDAQRKR